MNLFNLFKRRGTAPVARDRLQILLAYERGSTRGSPDLLRHFARGDPDRHRPPCRDRFQSRQRPHGPRRQGLDPRSRRRNSEHGADGASRRPAQAGRASASFRILIAAHVARADAAPPQFGIFVKFFRDGTKLPLICRPLPLTCAAGFGGFISGSAPDTPDLNLRVGLNH